MSNENYRKSTGSGKATSSRPAGNQAGAARGGATRNSTKRRSSNKRRKRGRRRGFTWNATTIGIAAGVVAALIFVIVYARGKSFYEEHFLPGSQINGIDVAKMTADEAQKILPYQLPTITITDGTSSIGSFDLSVIGGSYSYKDELDELIAEQESGKWLFRRGLKEYELEPVLSYDVSKIRKIVEALDIVTDPNATLPQNAYITKTDSGFAVVAEVPGTKIDAELLVQVVTDDLAKWIYTIDASEAVIKPAITTADLIMTDTMNAINAYNYIGINMSGGAYETMDKATAMSLINYDGDQTVTVNESAVATYVAGLAAEYNTLGDVRTFTTHDGVSIRVGGSDKDSFGYEMDQATTAERISRCLLTGADTSAKWPVAGFTRTADNDFGKTYVEVSISQQHLWYYVNGSVVLETDVVTGTGINSTTPGVFMILNKQSPATLTGEGYSTDVTYWMPVTYSGTGLHDATWRTEFGQDVYVSGGSHGCVNMPLEEVAALYGMIEMGTPVIIY